MFCGHEGLLADSTGRAHIVGGETSYAHPPHITTTRRVQLLTKLIELARAAEVELSATTQERLLGFADLLRQWNARTSLVSSRPESLVDVAFGDALWLARLDVTPRNARLVDVGAGGGVPMLPLLLLRDDVQVTLVEPRRKRLAFMRSAIGRWALTPRARLVEEPFDPQQSQITGAPFDLAWSRATFAPAEWLPMGATLAPRVGAFCGSEAPPLPLAGWSVELNHRYHSLTGAPRQLVVYRYKIHT